MYGDSTLSSKVSTGFFVVLQTFTTVCSSLEFFFEILKTSRHQELAFLWRDVLRNFNGFLSGYKGVVKVQAPLQTFYFAQTYWYSTSTVQAVHQVQYIQDTFLK
jgi:hypothetical protein